MPIFGNEIRTGSSAGGFEPENTAMTNYYYGGWAHYAGDGILGQNNTIGVCSPVQIGDHIWKILQGGPSEEANHAGGIKTDGTLWMWGNNNYGQLGNGAQADISSPIQVGTLTNWLQICPTKESTYAVKVDGTLWTWGYNTNGQLADGSTINRSSPAQIGSLTDWGDGEYSIENNFRIADGDDWGMVIKTDGKLWAWGYNTLGQLGQGNTIDISSPVQVGTDTWLTVAGGQAHGLGINSDGELFSWGKNSSGQLGHGNTTNLSTLTQVGSATNWTDIGVARNFSSAINAAGELWTWGQGNSGQLGQGNTSHISTISQVGTLTNWKYVECAMEALYAVKTDGTLWFTGNAYHGPMGNKTGLSSPAQVGTRTDWTFPVQNGTGGFVGTSATI